MKTFFKLRRKQTQAGFNLIEVCLAVAIAAFALVGMASLLPIASQGARRVADNTIIGNLVNDLFQYRRLTDWGSGITGITPAMTAGATTTVYADADGNFPVTSNKYFVCTCTVSAKSGIPSTSDIACMQITVQWPLLPSGSLAPNYNTRNYVATFSRKR